MVTDRFPELSALGTALPEGVVIDGEILPWRDDKPMPFAQLQQRIGRKNVTKKILADVPVTIVAYDLIEFGGEDIRPRPLVERRALLARITESLPDSIESLLSLSPSVEPHRGMNCASCAWAAANVASRG